MTNKHRIFCMLNGILALMMGVLIYTLFRENIYLLKIERYIGIQNLVLNIQEFFSEKNILIIFLKNYFVDFLWTYSYIFILCLTLNIHDKRKFVYVSIFVFFISVLYEITQYYDLVKGTFDFFDIVMYMAASVTAVTINIKHNKRRDNHEKSH